jgi:hypothetical protein
VQVCQLPEASAFGEVWKQKEMVSKKAVLICQGAVVELAVEDFFDFIFFLSID